MYVIFSFGRETDRRKVRGEVILSRQSLLRIEFVSLPTNAGSHRSVRL